MANYSDPNFTVKQFYPAALAVAISTATASGTAGHTLSAVIPMPKFPQRTEIQKIRVRCAVIPNAASTAVTLNFLNGTNTFGVVTLTTATAGQWLEGVITASNAIIADDVVPTVNMLGTSTASAAASGTYDVWLETQRLWDTSC